MVGAHGDPLPGYPDAGDGHMCHGVGLDGGVSTGIARDSTLLGVTNGVVSRDDPGSPERYSVAVRDGEPLQDDVIGGDLDAAHRGPIGRQPDRRGCGAPSGHRHLGIGQVAPGKAQGVSRDAAFRAADTSSGLVIVRVQPGGRLWEG